MPTFPSIKELQGFKVVFFDLDNTIYPYEPAHKAALNSALTKFAFHYDLDMDTANNLYREARKIINQRLHGQAASHSRLLYFKEMLTALNHNTQFSDALQFEKIYWQEFLTEMIVFPEALKLIKQLNKRGIVLGIITDLTAQIQLQKMKKLKLETYFSHIITSEEIGVEKPHSAIFRHALNLFEVDGDQCAMIGDNIKTDQGAENLGMKFYLV
ncbi:MAG: HAD-IA family hydrolase [bacterium]|nr:HAD-IA family hydrolase [bacterium]